MNTYQVFVEGGRTDSLAHKFFVLFYENFIKTSTFFEGMRILKNYINH